MSLSKIQNDSKCLAPTVSNDNKCLAPTDIDPHPQELLNTLKEKQELYEMLKTRGLVHQQINLEKDLQLAITELETLLENLETTS